MLEPIYEFNCSSNNSDDKIGGFKFLIAYFEPYNKYIWQLFLELTSGSIHQLIFLFLTQAFVDYGINYQNLDFVYLILVAQLMLFISQTSVELIRSWILLHMTSRINISLLSDFLVKLMRLPIDFFDSKNTGDIIQRIYDHERIQDFLSSTTLNTLFSVFNLLVFGSILVFYNKVISLVFIVGSILYVSWTLLFLKKRAELDFRRFDQESENQSSLYQLISGMQEIKLNGSEKRRRWEWETIQIKLFKISLKGLTITQLQNIGGRFINELKNILITFIAAKSVIQGNLTLGMMLSVQYIIGQLNLPLNNFILFLQNGQDAKLSLSRLSEIHNKQNEEIDTTEYINKLPENKTIAFDQVTFKYGDDYSPIVLNNISFTIPEGKVTAIVGSSGSGKTTLIKMLLKFYEPLSGRITVGGIELKNFNTSMWRSTVGSVMQEGFLFSDTIKRNITESDSQNRIDKKRFNNSIQMSNIDEFVKRQSLGYETKIGPNGINISGGQKQRVLIARAIYKNPKYLFFDEATSALDAENEKVIINNLQKFYIGRTVVIVAHRLSTVKAADNIIVLDKGEIIEQGHHKDLVALRGTYYSLVKNQLELGN